MSQLDRVEIPNRSLFRQPEVCEIASIQPYVLRSWEAEFPDLGVARTQGGPRVYRKADVERVLRLKHLLFVEGLTLAGARRRLSEERAAVTDAPPDLDDLAELLGKDARERLLVVKNGLRSLAAMLARAPGAVVDAQAFELEGPTAAAVRAGREKSRPVRAVPKANRKTEKVRSKSRR